MRTETSKKFAEVIDSIVAKPRDQVVKELSRLASQNPSEPAFPLAMAMVLGFGDEVGNRDIAQKHLSHGQALIRQQSAQLAEDPDFQFAANLATILEIEFDVAAKHSQWLTAEREMQRATLKQPADERNFHQTILNAVRALSMLSLGPSNRKGKEGLTKEFSNGRAAPNFAGFALAYAHRQDMETEAELRIANQLVGKHPNSILALEVLSHAQGASGNRAAAVEAYERALRLAPNSLPVQIGLSIAQRKAGNLEAARRTIQNAIRTDTSGRFARYTRNILISLEAPLRG